MNLFRMSTQKIQFISAAQLFFSLSILFSTWVIYIPSITEKLKMSEGQLGITLLFGAIGSIIGTISGNKLIIKFGDGITALNSIMFQAFVTIGLFIATSFYQLTAALFLFGLFGGVFQVSVNALVIAIERMQKSSIMSSCHGFFSLGGIISAGFGTFLLIAINNPLLHIILIVSLVFIFQLTFKKHIINIKNELTPKPKEKVKKGKSHAVLVLLALIAMSAMVSEGAIADWSGLYLKDMAKVNPNYLGLGYAGFSLAMTIGRFTGDYFSKKFMPFKIILVGFVISIAGLIAVLTKDSFLSLIGFFIVGVGFSVIVPIVYRLSASLKDVNPSTGIAFLAGTNYVGFLAGPPILGFIAEKYDLSVSFIVILALVGFGGLITYSLQMGSKVQLVEAE